MEQILPGAASGGCELVAQVRAAGGIPFVKTNIPQTMMTWQCSNPVFGTTTNPWSANHTSGGFSGGEAALLACDGSAFGFGSDIGGRHVLLLCNIPGQRFLNDLLDDRHQSPYANIIL
ncbi:Fatty-acid amide hydrolase 2 [Tulasnella sp. 331]|nr:Fatty-acid amide hydrolase 2 [Tulasnella sp. 331]